jgi:hypothetical protein
MLTLSACGGDNSTVITNTGGAASTGGTSSVGGGGSTGGTTSTSTSTCAPTKVPTNALMTNFSEVTDGTVTPTDVSSISWGDPSATLTGGTFVYDQNPPDAPTGTVTGGALDIAATVTAGEYAGFGFYFGPNCGSDASAYTGFKFDISGSMPGIQLDIQVQMTPDYPLKDANKGTCDYVAGGYTSDTKWNYCTNPHVHFEDLPGYAAVSDTVQTVSVPWSVLVGGNPVNAIDSTQLLGIQLQFNCGTTDCPVAITIDNLSFYN